VVIALNLSATAQTVTIGFPRPGKWAVRFNSNSAMYDQRIPESPDVEIGATATPADGLEASASVAIGSYSVMIFSQDQ
jgi:1,4-alpha-glucan branching enzyme